ncbi:MAG TPA: glycosyltransferase family 4 protein [Pyrinomonadaceae bacterium]|nr:glycosyltransferase family 4 protein [Pyrinomonadaceae bacterium]
MLMKILLINDYAEPIGGAEVMTLALRDELRRRGHDARIFASSAQLTDAASAADYLCFGTMSRFRTLLQTANPWAFWRLREVLKEFRPDVIHVKMFLTQLSPLILPLLKDVPALYHVVWYRPVCPKGTKMLPDKSPCRVRAGAACYRNGCLLLRDFIPLMLQMRMWRHWRKVFRRIVANSAATKEQLTAGGVEGAEVVWNGVPVAPRLAPLSSTPTIVFAGRLVPEKGVDALVRAFARVASRISGARLLLAGDGPERERIQELVGELKLSTHVALLGHLTAAEMERRFAGAWVQAVPSRWAEPFGLTATEAMMRGTAVVASASGGLAEIVRDGETGFLVQPDNVDALASALLKILGDRDLAERMGENGREVALKHFSQATFVNNFLRLYEEILSAA